MVKCEACKKEFREEEGFVFNKGDSKIYCCSDECFTSYLTKRKEIEDRKLLYATVGRIFGITTYKSVKIMSEIKHTCEREHLAYKNLASVLHYMYEIKGIPIYSPTLYYVPQYKEEAAEYYREITRRAKQADELIKKDKARNSTVVKPNYNTNKRKTGLKIDPNDV